MRATLATTVLLASATAAFAQSPNVDSSFRPGANHHIGDDAFVAKYHRDPTDADEKLRMREHFLAAKALLSARPATKPALEARRKQILAAFDDYIAKGTTPKNDHLPWRTPVFIDDEGTICAVGYLIERTAGREVAERVAASHRYSYLEEIAKAMPDVAAWVESSGFTLTELSTIQPGYEGPDVANETGWNLVKAGIEDGAYDQDGVTGTIAHHEMEGRWTVKNADGHVLGFGDFTHGHARWHSQYADGHRMAEGNYTGNRPTGTWHFFHPSGNLAAEGTLAKGMRDGEWSFFYDAAKRIPIAHGSFKNGFVSGAWQHFDSRGKLLATSRPDRVKRPENSYGSLTLLDIVPGKDGITHRISQGNDAGDQHRLDELISKDRKEHLFVQGGSDRIFDATGMTLTKTDGGWLAQDCQMDAARKRAAKQSVGAFHALIYRDNFSDNVNASCNAGVRVSPERAARIDQLTASIRAVRAQSPDFVRKLALGEATPEDAQPVDVPAAAPEAPKLVEMSSGFHENLAEVIAANMTWYVEWPHIDIRFRTVYGTLPGMHTSATI